MVIEHGSRVEGRRLNACQDRAATFEREGVVVAVVADGAGGVSGGTAAADAVVRRVQALAGAAAPLMEAGFWSDALIELNRELLGRGETTAVVLATNGAAVAGASVGDSGAWAVGRDRIVELSAGQPKQAIGRSPTIDPLAIRAATPGYALLLASDGLAKYAAWNRIEEVVRLAGISMQGRLRTLVDACRLPNGNLQDDVGIALVRRVEKS